MPMEKPTLGRQVGPWVFRLPLRYVVVLGRAGSRLDLFPLLGSIPFLVTPTGVSGPFGATETR